MDTTMIQELLDRYWNGDTTLEEERMLKAYFAQASVPEQFQRDAQWFRALQVERAVQMERQPAQASGTERFKHISRALAAAVVITLLMVGSWRWSVRHQTAAPLPVAALVKPPLATPEIKPVTEAHTQTVSLPAPEKIKRRRKCKAAPALQPAPADTFDDPEKAMAEIRAALSLVSSKINKSRREAEKGLLEMDNVEILLKKKNING